MEIDVIPELPEIRIENYHTEDQGKALSEFILSKRKILIYENNEGQLCFYFKGLDHIFYASFVVSLSCNDALTEDIYNFLKLCLEGTRMIKQCTKKGHELAVRIENSMKKRQFPNK